MGSTVLLVENLFSRRQFPAHNVAAEEEPLGFEARRAANGRRSTSNYASASTVNSDWWIKVSCDRVRSASLLVLDRGHNLAGQTVTLQVSDDDLVWADVVSTVLPTVAGPASLDGAVGVRTEEGAWMIRFPTREGRYWRVFTPAAANLTPRIVGLYLGIPLTIDALDRPLGRNRADIQREVRKSGLGWRGTGPTAVVRTSVLRVQLTSLFDYELARYHLEGQYVRHRPMWILHDDEEPHRALLAACPEGEFGFVQTPRFFYPEAEIPYVEWEPKEVGS